MQSLQQKASEWSGVAASDAFAIDETNLFETLGGIQPFVDLSTNFYNRVYDDEEEWFRSIFSNSKKEDASSRSDRESRRLGRGCDSQPDRSELAVAPFPGSEFFCLGCAFPEFANASCSGVRLFATEVCVRRSSSSDRTTCTIPSYAPSC
ncbi:uncharacterized protein LOC141840468 [Curcuma longa]|uniref:uncharacterized protein LOC141840468 n=1 Tax=Curcuma longa TaxID=136217 RepID=UPI003D9F6458